MTTGSTATSNTTLPIHHKAMVVSSARGLVRGEEAAEDPVQRHKGGPQADREALRRRRGAFQRLTALRPADLVLQVDREVAHEHGGDVGDHPPAVLRRCAGQLQVLRYVYLCALTGAGQHGRD